MLSYLPKPAASILPGESEDHRTASFYSVHHNTPGLHERKLKTDAGIKIIEEVTPAFKNGVLIFVLRELIVDVIEADGFGIQMFLHPADAVPPHFQIRNRPLHRQVMLFLLFRFCLCRRLEEFLEDAAEQRLLILFFSQ